MNINHLLLLLSFCLFTIGPTRAAERTFDQWADDFAVRWVRLNPQFATRVQYFSGAEQDALDRQLILGGAFGQTYGVKAAQERAEFARRGLEELPRFPAATLTAQQRTSAAVIQWSLEDAVRRAAFAQHSFVFEQFGGLHLGFVNFLTSTHPIRNVRDIENYLARLALVAPRIGEGIAEAKAAAAAGLIPPRFILQRVIEQLDGFTAQKPADNPFVATLDMRIATLGAAVSAEQRAKFVAAAEKEAAAAIIPAYQGVRALLAAQLPGATDDAGAWRLPRGGDFYANSLESLTTTKLTPAEIHAIGLREVTSISAEMEAILQQLGYKEGTIQARIENLNATLNPLAEPDPRLMLVAKVEALVHDAERRSVAVFDLRPKAPVTVKREPAFSEKSAAAHYTNPAPDGSSPGIYWLPLADLSPRVTWLGVDMKSTAYHEAVPGHHFQLTIQQESQELPRYRKLGVFGFNSSYIEGWALYAERLAAENGWYEGDLPGRLGYLHLQLFRARRLVADTGLHAMKWTRQQVIDYGFTPQETERYIVWPGQACSYMIGQLRILELREKAKAALGARFSIKEFHNLVLRGGSMPLDVLAQEVDAWVAAKRAGGLGGMGSRPLGREARASAAPPPKAGLVIVGAGISGLAAALDAGRAGANVTVIDMWSVFGGHAVMSGGLVCLVDTPFQREHNVADSPDLAIRDFLTHGQDANLDWVRLYARDSKREVYDWLEALGVGWSGLFPLMPGNSVQRQHSAKQRGVGLISPIYRECLRWTNIHFVWNTKVTSLLIEDGQVRGVRGVGLRNGLTNDFRSPAVVLATGGFESNLELVRQHWPTVLPGLAGGAKVLLGSGINSLGSGLDVATGGGAALTHLDHQLFYSTGLVDPRDPSRRRGLNSFNAESIWVNQQGRRFVREIAGRVPDFGGSVPAVLRQAQATYWSIFDSRGRAVFFVSGSGWDDTNNVQREIFDNPRMREWVKQSDTLDGLAQAAGLPSDALAQSVRRWNEMLGLGEDTEWQRFGRGDTNRPSSIATPPFYAVQYFPLSRKSMGGVAVDLSCRVLDRRGQPIPNLYAVGELAGVGGINGRAALEGTMLGPGLLMGRIAAREIVAHVKTEGRSPAASIASAAPEKSPATKPTDPESLRAWREVLRQLVVEPRPGYLHFEKAHTVVLERNFDCVQCHRESWPLALTADQLDRHALIQTCVICHGSVKE